MRVALAQVNPCVGDLDGNLSKLLDHARQARDRGADLVVFGDAALTGAPLDGLVDSATFVNDVQMHLDAFAKSCPLPALISCVSVNELDDDTLTVVPELYLAGTGELLSIGAPALLESHVVPVMQVSDAAIAVLLGDHFASDADLEEVDVLIEMSCNAFGDDMAAPAARGDLSRMSAVASACNAYFACVNICGAADVTVFAGNSTATAPNGSLMHAAPIDEEDLFVFDTTSKVRQEVQDRPQVELKVCEVVWRALVAGTRDYVQKNGFADVLIGLSGGIDSAVVATVAVDALGADHVHGMTMPGPYSSAGSLDDARALAKNLGITCINVPISEPLDAFCDVLAEPCGGKVDGLAAENLQARVRTVELMTVSNTYNWLLLNTGNKSEAAMGFSTLYGDTAGAYAPIGDIYKTEVYELAEWRSKQGRSIPRASIDKEPSAELYEGARDADRLPPYEKLDELLEAHIEGELGAAELVEQGFDEALVHDVLKTVRINEYKRRCEPIAPHVLGISFGGGRSWPITNGWTDPATK